MVNSLININIAGDFFLPNLEGWSFDTALSVLLQDGDVNVINFEAPVRTEEAVPIKKSGPSLCQDAQAPQWLIKKGFNLFDCANNHIYDFGAAALHKTLDSIAFPAQAVGVGDFHDAYSIKAIEVKGKKIGFLALTQYEFGVHDDEMYTHQEFKAAWMCHPIVDEIICNAHSQCDILIVLPHAGLEHFSLPLPEIRTLYRHFISMGADAVVASHPHVPQPWEEYQGKPIFYSLGNFCFDMPVQNRPLWNQGLIAQLQIDTSGKVGCKTFPVKFSVSQKCVSLYNNEDLNSYLDKLNEDFRNETIYIDTINKHCLSLYPLYQTIMEMGGYYQVFSLHKAASLLKKIIVAVIKKTAEQYNEAHFVNTMRCETHRWVMSRIYELKNR